MALPAPLLIVVSDLVSAHVGWFVPGARRHLVPSEHVRRQALRCGVPPERVEVMGGIPVRSAFAEAQCLSKASARAQLGLPEDLPLVLVVGGGDGMGPFIPVVRAIAARRPQAHVVAIAGRNVKRYEQLCNMELPAPVQVRGFVTNMEIWLRAADLLVTKAGPNTLCEAFVCGPPVVLYSAIRGQEEGNVEYVLQNRVGVWAPRPEQAADEVISLLADPSRRRCMAARQRALANPNVTELVAQRIWAASQHVVVPTVQS
jgi:1,2-diacylglycerol 3-beta-galactosyltransferase